MKSLSLPVCAALSILWIILPAGAEPFIESANENSRNFHSGLDDFKDALSETGQRMRSDHDYAVLQDSRRHRANQQMINEGTQLESQQSFLNSQRQAINSGGFFNNNSGFNQIGFYGIGPNGSVTFAPIGSGSPPFVLQPAPVQSRKSNFDQQEKSDSGDSTKGEPFKDPFAGFTLPASRGNY